MRIAEKEGDFCDPVFGRILDPEITGEIAKKDVRQLEHPFLVLFGESCR